MEATSRGRCHGVTVEERLRIRCTRHYWFLVHDLEGFGTVSVMSLMLTDDVSLNDGACMDVCVYVTVTVGR